MPNRRMMRLMNRFVFFSYLYICASIFTVEKNKYRAAKLLSIKIVRFEKVQFVIMYITT